MTYSEKEKKIPNKDAFKEVYGEKNPDIANALQQVSDRTQYRITEPHKVYIFIKNFLASVKTPSPIILHINLAEKTLKGKIEKSNPQYQDYVQFLAEELRVTMNALEEKIPHISNITKFKKNPNPSYFEWIDVATSLPTNDQSLKEADRNCFDKKGVFKPLNVYIKTIELLGINGKNHAKKIKGKNLSSDSTFWFNIGERRKDEPFFFSAAFLGISRIILEDKIEKRISFANQYPPSVTLKTFGITNEIISSSREKSVKFGKVNLVNKGDIVGTVNFSEIPIINSKLHSQIFCGLGKLNTVIGHKTLRYAVALPFKQKKHGIEDFRIKKYQGGVKEIAEEIGISSGRQINELRDILYALKYLIFPNNRGGYTLEGNFINLTRIKNNISGRDDGIILTIEPALVGLGEINAKGSLLIPMATIFPPIHRVTPNQYHGNLFHLQMKILEKFSIHSIEFSQYGHITINPEDWNELLKKVKIPMKYKDNIVNSWEFGDNNSPPVLTKKGEHQYSLSSAYQASTKFLMDQGKFRLIQKFKGKKSARNKIFHIKNKHKK